MSEDVIKHTQKDRNKNGNTDHNQSKSNSLASGWPAYMFEFTSGFFEIFEEFHEFLVLIKRVLFVKTSFTNHTKASFCAMSFSRLNKNRPVGDGIILPPFSLLSNPKQKPRVGSLLSTFEIDYLIAYVIDTFETI